MSGSHSQVGSASSGTKLQLGKLSTILLLSLVFFAGFLAHSLLQSAPPEVAHTASVAKVVHTAASKEVANSAAAAEVVHRAHQPNNVDSLKPPAKAMNTDSSSSSNMAPENYLSSRAAPNPKLRTDSANSPSSSSTSRALSQEEPVMQAASSASNDTDDVPRFFSRSKEPRNAAARKVECQRWQSDLDQRLAFDSVASPGVSVTAQHSQDILMYKTLLHPLILGRNHGFYIDLAANLPRSLSNTYFLDVCRGWTGLCIEAQPLLVAKLSDRDRWGRTCTIIDTCVADRLGVEVEFVLSGGIGGISGVRNKGQDEEWVERMKRIGHEYLLDETSKMKTTKMKCTTLEAELRKVPNVAFPGGTMPDGRKVVDFMSLDIEAAEYLALKGTNFDDVFIRYILMELGPLYIPGSSTRIPYNEQPFYNALELLKEKGFSALFRLNLDVVFVHKDALRGINMEQLRTTCNKHPVQSCHMCSDSRFEEMCSGIKPNRVINAVKS